MIIHETIQITVRAKFMKGELWVDGIMSSCNGPLKYNVTCNIHVIFYLRRNNPLELTGYLLPWKDFGMYL